MHCLRLLPHFLRNAALQILSCFPHWQTGLTDAENDAARTEAENTVTYSLLSHPDVAEEDSESDYQKRL